MILTGRQCIHCGSDQWFYPPRTTDRVRVTCVGCGRYIAHYPYDQLGEPTANSKQSGASPEDQEPAKRRGADPSQGWFWQEAIEAKTRKQLREEREKIKHEEGWD